MLSFATVFPGLERCSEVPLLQMSNLIVIVEGRVGGGEIWSDQVENGDPTPEGRPLQPLQRLVARSHRVALVAEHRQTGIENVKAC